MVSSHYHEMARKNMMTFCCNHLMPFLKQYLMKTYSAVKVLVVETPVNSSVELGADFSCKAQCLLEHNVWQIECVVEFLSNSYTLLIVDLSLLVKGILMQYRLQKPPINSDSNMKTGIR